MQLGVFAKTFAGTDPATVLAAVREAGFSVAQYNMACSGLMPMPEEIEADDVSAIASAAERSGIGIAAVSGTFNMIHPDLDVRERGLRRLDVLAAAAHGMGTRLITVCTGTRDREDQWRAHGGNDTPHAWRDLTATMERALAIAEAHDIDLGIEPELANVVNSAEKARRLIDEMGSSRIKIVLDPANLFDIDPPQRRRDIVAEAVDLLADRIALGHAKDRDSEGGFVTAGRGVLDYPHYFACLKRVGFDGAVVAHGLEAEEAPRVAAYLGALI